MLQSIPKNQFKNSQETFISELADIKVFETHLIDYQAWQIYYQDLSAAAQTIRQLIKK